jgi:hypothetical protein
VDDIAIASTVRISCRSPLVDKALQDLAEMAVTEACLSGLCDFCLYHGTGLCTIFGRQWEGSRPSGHPRKPKNSSGATQ